jgi:GT2 family glycosyltransferase
MPTPLQADVIVPIHSNPAMTLQCLESVLAHSGPTLRSLIAVNNGAPEPDMPERLAEFARRDRRVLVLRSEVNIGFVGACNLALAERQGDALLLNNDTIVTPGWLQELAEVVHSDARTACAAPLSNNATIFSVPDFDGETPADRVDARAVLAACAKLPRSTEMSTCHGFCIYMNGKVLDLIGHLDTVFAPGYNEENDWVMRAKAMGFVARRANRAFVYHLGTRSFRREKEALEQRNSRILAERHPHYYPLVMGFTSKLDARLAAHAARVESSGVMRVAFDLRHVPPGNPGEAACEIGLARSLSGIPEVELTLVMRHLEQAAGIPARLVSAEDQLLDVELIHRPAEVFNAADLRLLFASPAHVIVTQPDLIAHRVQALFGDQEAADRHRTTNALALRCAQAVITPSEESRREIVAEYGLPEAEIAVIPPGLDPEPTDGSGAADRRLLRDLRPPPRFFLCLADDFPHMNLRNLVQAHALLRRRWCSPGDPPGLVLVGSRVSVWGGAYGDLPRDPSAAVVHIEAVTAEQRGALYRSAEALVFPSVYEGFGLPILRSMAHGTPVIALSTSSVPEASGDCVLYAEGFSAEDVARAMERLAADSALRGQLRDRGLERAKQFTRERTARATVELYRSTILQPSHRSLEMRRMFREAIIHWSRQERSAAPLTEPGSHHAPAMAEPLGIRNAYRALNLAVHRRLRRELNRLPTVIGRKRA